MRPHVFLEYGASLRRERRGSRSLYTPARDSVAADEESGEGREGGSEKEDSFHRGVCSFGPNRRLGELNR